MTRTARAFIGAGALVMALGVALGAYAAHAAAGAKHPDAARLLNTAVQYQLIHGVGVIAIGLLCLREGSRWLVASGSLLLAGVVLFCGSLWALALAGGLCFIAGWLALSADTLRQR